ncbi:MAG: CPBP family intramembrane metalloprotease [Lachnospiraceae bacterium]|nr:CPBP family intramembrane metalloprotease [Lachnospiraceae bacterium]
MEKLNDFRKKHVILKRPVIAGVLLCLVMFVLTEALPGFLRKPLHIYERNSQYEILATVVGLILLFIHKLWFAPEYKGSFSRLKVKKDVIICIAAFLGVVIIGTIIDVAGGSTLSLTASKIFAGITPGVIEEVAFRAVPMSVMMWTLNDKKHNWLVAVLPAVVFGVMHLVNLTGGANIGITLMQVFVAMASGLMFCAIYLKTGNVLYTMVPHAIYDIICDLPEGDYVDGVATFSLTPGVILTNCVPAVVALICAIILLRKSEYEGIYSVWKERWNK